MAGKLAESAREWQLALLPGLWGIGAGVVTFALLGYVSWRAFRQMPDFPEKAAMVRGAIWGAPIFAALSLVVFGVLWVGAGVGLAMTGLCLGKALFWTCFAVSMHRFRLESEGLLTGPHYWFRYRRQSPGKWYEDWQGGRQKADRYNRILLYWWPVLISLWLAFGAWGYLKVDRPCLRMMADERFGALLRGQLQDPHVVEVVPMRSSFEGPLSPLHINVTPATTPQQAAQLAERLQQVLAGRGDRNAWRIVVRPEHGHTLAKTMHVPPGVVLPVGIEKQHPRPRKW